MRLIGTLLIINLNLFGISQENNENLHFQNRSYLSNHFKSNKMSQKKTVGGLAGINAGDSKIATVGLGNGLNYRGYNIEELAKNSTFEEVFYLLLFERLPLKHELDAFI